MAKAKQLTSGNWRVQVSVTLNGQTLRRSFTESTKRKAESQAEEWQNHCKMIGNDFTSMTVAEAMRQYIDTNEKDLSPSTVREYERILSKDMQDIKDKKLRALTCPLIKESMNLMAEKGLSAKTIKNRYGFLRAVLAVYYPDFIWAVKSAKQAKRKKRCYSHHYIKQILNAIKGDPFELEVYLGMMSMRESEICGLMFSDINYEESYLDICQVKLLNKNSEYVIVKFTKTDDSARRVYLPSYVLRLVKERQKKASSEFVTEVNPNRFWGRLNQITKKHGIEKLKFHELRHIYSSLTSALGIDEQIRMENGGWSNASIMDGTYRHPMSEAQIEANDKMDQYVNEITTSTHISHEISHGKSQRS